MLKVDKSSSDFTYKANQFYLDVGWIRLTKLLQFNEVMLNDFKNTELDPRELVLLYKNLVLNNSENSLKKHF